MTTIQQSNLAYQQGSSDKVYHITLEQVDNGYVVNFQYGRRGSTLTAGTKTPTPVTLEEAQKIFDRLEREKLAKGYKPTGLTASAQALVQKEDTGIYPQLLNEIAEEQMEALLEDDRYGMQEKMDDKRLLIEARSAPNVSVRGVNRKGQAVSMPQAVGLEALSLLSNYSSLILDGEAIGDKLYVFDLLEINGLDERQSSVATRYTALQDVVDGCTSIEVVPMYYTTRAKKLALKQIQGRNGEGVVFKRLDAPYTSGRPNSGGTQLKFKFWAEADVVICESRAGKRSVGMQVYDGQGRLVQIGNVTIPANYDVPAVGQVGAVKYLYYYPGGSLYQPQWRGVRDDKDPAECVMSQLKHKAAVDEDDAEG